MKKLFLILTVFFCLFVIFIPKAPALTGVVDITTVASSSAASVAHSCTFHGIIIATDGTNDVTLNVYDHASAASGKKIVPTNTTILGSARLWTLSYDPPIRCTNGVYVAITCSGTAYFQVLYGR